jgi:hypothetical protein
VGTLIPTGGPAPRPQPGSMPAELR